MLSVYKTLKHFTYIFDISVLLITEPLFESTVCVLTYITVPTVEGELAISY